MGVIWIVNDTQTTIPGTRTLWHNLAEWLDGEWVGDAPYPLLAGRVEALATNRKPDLIIRNATYFGPIGLPGIPTISLIQDIMPGHTYQRIEQVRVARLSKLVVFNSAYTKAQYPELAGVPSRIIPLSVDFDLFRPIPNAKPLADICWIGAPTWVKGWDILGEVIRKMPTVTFALVLKEHSTGRVPDNVQVFTRVPHSELPTIISGCQIGLCTSRQETQHLAGCEMGACGLTLVAPRVGIYAGSSPATVYTHKFGTSPADYVRALEYALTMTRWTAKYTSDGWYGIVSPEACKGAWKEAVAWSLSN